MSGGFPRPAFRLPSLAMLALPAALALPGCSLFISPQPAPISEAEVIPVEPASAPAAASAPEPAPAESTEKEPARKPKPPPPRPRKPEEPPPPVAAPVAPPPPPPPLIITRLIQRNEARALLDSNVQRPDGRVLGRAVDLIAGPDGKPQEMVVNLQGFLGIGDRKVSLPWSAFRFTPDATKAAPITLTVVPTKLPAPDASKPNPATQLPLLDATIERPNGAKVGRVVDVLIDANAQPQALVLDVSGGMVSTDRRTIAANWSAMHIVMKDKVLKPLIDLSEAQINASPPYEADKPVRAVSPAAPAAPAPAGASLPAVAASNARNAR